MGRVVRDRERLLTNERFGGNEGVARVRVRLYGFESVVRTCERQWSIERMREGFAPS